MIRAIGRAKVNLWLAIVGRRPDGYHELETVMQSITLADDVTIRRAAHSEVTIRWAEGLEGPLPAAPDIVQRTVAAARLRCPEKPAITVDKRIPIGAGLGGASADAAAALLGLARMDGDGDSFAIGELARQLGADVPFCLSGGLALATGVGDRLTPLSCPTTMWWVLGIPGRQLSTVAVYQRYDELVPVGGRPSENGQPALAGPLLGALEAGDVEAVAGQLANDLEVAAFDLMPELAALKEGMQKAGALAALMTGSGSALIGLCRDEAHARAVAGRAADLFPRIEVASSAAAGAELVES